ncbi:MAG TPA: sulfotransferase domain-containing protein [Nocardioidaceae bacterium]
MGDGGRVQYKTVVYDSSRWDRVVFRPGDIVITTPAKCGTTWLQMICALLVFQTPDLYAPLDTISPWVDMLTKDLPSVLATLEAQEHRRFMKTHTCFDGLPFDERVTYICVGRDPRDVAVSWDNHRANTDMIAFLAARERAVGLDDIADLLADGPPVEPEAWGDRFWAWVENEEPVGAASSLHTTLDHLGQAWGRRERPNVLLLHYQDLTDDLDGQMRVIANRLGITVPETTWPELVEAATFDRMRERATEIAPETPKRLWLNERDFFRQGRSGQWRDLLDDTDVARYAAAVERWADPEVAAWVHRPPLPAGPST